MLRVVTLYDVSQTLESNAPDIPMILVVFPQCLTCRPLDAAAMDDAAQRSASGDICWYICPCKITHILMC